MSLVSTIMDLFSQLQGGFIYHLLILFIIEAALAMAYIEWRRSHQRQARDIAIAFFSLFVMRLILMGMDALELIGVFPSPIMLIIVPPLERLFMVVGTGLLCWAFLSPPSRESRMPDILLAVNSIAALLSYSVLVPLWYMDLQANPTWYQYYTFHWQDSFWTLWQVVLLILGCTLCLWRKIEEREFLFAAFVILLLGHLLHLLAIYPQGLPHLPVWPQLAEMVVFPLLAVVVYRITSRELRSANQEPITMDDADLLQEIEELGLLIEASQTVSESPDLDTTLGNVARNMVMMVDADQCAIILKEETDSSKMGLIASYDAQGAKAEPKEKVHFFLQEQPLIKRAIDARSQLLWDTNPQDDPEMRALYTVLGTKESGPVMIQPISLQDEVLGVIILANHRTKQPFSGAQGSICRALMVQMAPAIKNSQRYQALSKEIGRLNRALDIEHAEALHNQQLILENIADGIIVSDENDKVIIVNNAAERILGMNQDKLIGQDVRDILGGLSWQSDVDMDGSGAATIVREAEGIEIPPLQTTSTVGEKRIRASIVPVMLDGDRFWGIVTILRDITEESEAEKTKTHLVANMSEELRTPMTSIRSYTDILLAEVVGILGKAQREYMQKIQTNVERMEEMLDDLTEIATVDTSKIKIQARPFDVERIIYQAVTETRQEMALKELKLNFNLPDELPAVHGDPITVQQILINLLHNAFDLSPASGIVAIKATVEPGTEWETPGTRAPRYLAISISNEGPSIAPSSEEKSMPAAQSAEIDLRLTVVKSLLETQGGRLWVESEGDTGNTFSFILPLAREGKEG